MKSLVANSTTPGAALTLRVLDIFSGIGGFSLGLERAGMKTVAFCEIEPFPRRVLAKHWPNVPIYDDVRTLTAERLATDGIAVDVICGGFPCQDISIAGAGAGLAGARSGLWREYARLIGELRPNYIIVENVSALISRGLSEILGDLAALRYDAEWHCIPASAIGAPHQRDRIWIVAYPNEGDKDGRRGSLQMGRFPFQREVKKARVAGITQWRTSPRLPRVAYGVPDRMERIGGYGNAVVPLIPELIGRAILAEST